MKVLLSLIILSCISIATCATAKQSQNHTSTVLSQAILQNASFNLTAMKDPLPDCSVGAAPCPGQPGAAPRPGEPGSGTGQDIGASGGSSSSGGSTPAIAATLTRFLTIPWIVSTWMAMFIVVFFFVDLMPLVDASSLPAGERVAGLSGKREIIDYIDAVEREREMTLLNTILWLEAVTLIVVLGIILWPFMVWVERRVWLWLRQRHEDTEAT